MRTGSRRRQQPDDSWTTRDDALWTTAEIAALMLQGRLGERHAIAVPFAIHHSVDERVLAFGPHALHEFRGASDGTYLHSTSTTLAIGRGAIPLMLGAAALNAAGNAHRRRNAAADAQPRWVSIGAGTMSVSDYGFYLHDATGLWPWGWCSIRLAELTAPG